MAEGRINLYNLGTQGVDLTKSKIHAEDGTWQQLQNAVPDPRGEFGSVSKRDGLVALNGSSAGGSITGIIDVPLPTVATRTFLFGRSTAVSQDWGISTDGFATASTTSSLADVADSSFTVIAGPSRDHGMELMGRTAYNGKIMLYPAGGYTQEIGGVGGTPPSIRMWDGTVDQELVKVPYNATLVASGLNTSGNALYLTDMVMDGERAFFGVVDFDAGIAGAYGRVFMLDIPSRSLTQLGGTFNTTGTLEMATPLSLCMYQGYLMCGTGNGAGTGTTVTGKMFRIRPGVDSEWTLETTFDADESVISMAVFQGLLYAGLYAGDAIVGELKKRAFDGTWTTLTDSGGVPTGEGSRASCLIVFEDNLYFHTTNMQGASSTSLIRKYTGAAVSTVYTYTIEAGNEPQLGLTSFHHNGVLYFLTNISDGSGTGNLGRIAKSVDGTTWTHLTAGTTLLNGRVGVIVS